MIRIFAFLLSLTLAMPAVAHDLRVFASVAGETVTVETKFSSGRVPTGGEVRVLDVENVVLITMEIGEQGLTEFTLPIGAKETGLLIEVDVSEGHSDYWVLTPDDIAHGQGTN